ncbi:MAG: YdcH family protein [Acidobacteria bacterium]|nr:YdcH family protein [Acidobacteriota bacterium]
MTGQAEQIRQRLLETSAEFRHLAEEHARLSEQLAALARKPRWIPEDSAEEARLKKLKLRAKDRMEELIRDYRRQQAEAVEAT